MIKWKDKEIETLREAPDLSVLELSTRLDRSPKSVARMRERLGLCKPKTKGEVNHAFFSVWSAEMAYVLGYWFADGCIFYDRANNSYYFDLSSKDLAHLVKIRSLFSSNHKLNPQVDNMFRLRFASKGIFDDIVRLGGHPSKSFTALFPVMSSFFKQFFIRGYLDGDGHISVKTNGYPELGFTGTENMLLGISKALPGPYNRLYKEKNIFRLRYYGDNAVIAMDLIYKENPAIFMERKHRRYLRSLEWKQER